ncbi:MAG: HD domain-containing phosphohydrolase [Carboxydocellales bacterium]
MNFNLRQSGLLVDAVRVPIAAIAFFSLFRQAGIEDSRAIVGVAVMLYSVVFLFLRSKNHKTNQVIESIKIIIDSFWIFLISSLLETHVLLVTLQLLQIFGVLLHFRFRVFGFALSVQISFHIAAEIFGFTGNISNYLHFRIANYFYFIVILGLTFIAWYRDRNLYINILKSLNDKALKMKNSIEIRRVLDFWDNKLYIEKHLYRITLENIGMDGIFFACQGDDAELVVGEVKGLGDGLLYEVTSRESIENLNRMYKNMSAFYTDFKGNENTGELQKLTGLWPGICTQYLSFAGFPLQYQGALLGLVLVFSPESKVFTELALAGFNKTISKTSFALKNLQSDSKDNASIEGAADNLTSQQGKGEKIPLKIVDAAAAMLGRMYSADKCLIALFDDIGREFKIQGIYGAVKVPVGSKLDLRENIIHQVVFRGEAVNLRLGSPAIMRNFLGESVSNLLCVPLCSKSQNLGFICLINKHTELTGKLVDFDDEDELLLRSLSDHVGVSLENKVLYEVLETTFLTTIRAMVNALDARDPYTKGHSDQVARYALLIGKELNFTETELENLRYAGLLHDIGKIGVAESILHKPTKLTPEEYSQMKLHTYFGRQILRPVSFFQKLLPAIYHHHERWDGQGYPDGLKEDEIPLEARILAVADTFDAIVSQRVYRKGREKEMAMNELIKSTGRQFDPRIVDAFLTAMDKAELSGEELLHWKLDVIRNIYRDVLLAVTQEQLVLADGSELAEVLKYGKLKLELKVNEKSNLPGVREKVSQFLEKLMIDKTRQKKFILCVSETVSNMLKHANGGIVQLLISDQNIWFVARDNGPGIRLRDIPKATLRKGYSTKKSLGFGFSIMLELLPRVYLETHEYGTTVVLEENR